MKTKKVRSSLNPLKRVNSILTGSDSVAVAVGYASLNPLKRVNSILTLSQAVQLEAIR